MSRESFKEKILAAADADVSRWGDRPMVMTLDLGTTLAVCGALQLALRHPKFTGPTAKLIREFVLDVEREIPAEFPGLHKLIQLGFDPQFDL